MAEAIEIVDYDPRWPSLFAALRDDIGQVLGPLAQQIEHVGSTAVPGLAAKPIIDIDVVISSKGDLQVVIQRFGVLGYGHEGDLGMPGREAFRSDRSTTAHHLYVCVAGSEALVRHLAFRDFLRQHPQTAQAYADMKQSLVHKFETDRDAYTEAKTTFIEQVLAEKG